MGDGSLHNTLIGFWFFFAIILLLLHCCCVSAEEEPVVWDKVDGWMEESRYTERTCCNYYCRRAPRPRWYVLVFHSFAVFKSNFCSFFARSYSASSLAAVVIFSERYNSRDSIVEASADLKTPIECLGKYPIRVQKNREGRRKAMVLGLSWNWNISSKFPLYFLLPITLILPPATWLVIITNHKLIN